MPRRPDDNSVPTASSALAPWVVALGATLLMQVVTTVATQALPIIAPLVTRSTGLAPEAIGPIFSVTMLGSVLFMAFGMPVLVH
jgi:hypothetical protein